MVNGAMKKADEYWQAYEADREFQRKQWESFRANRWAEPNATKMLEQARERADYFKLLIRDC